MGLLSTIGAASGRAFGLTRVGAAIRDAYFNLTTLLLPGNGTNGAQNNTFLDSSTNNFTITRNGNTTQGTFTPFSQTGWSGNFNTSTTYLTVTDTANLRFGSSNFTIEAWVYRAASGAIQTIASKGASTPTGWVFQISAADKLVFTDTSTSITGATTLNANTWYYVAVVRAGTGTNQTTLYVNAASDATGTSSTNFNQTNNMLIGADRSTANFANGYISNLRLSNTNRTISSTPTSALTADANTIFLALNSNWFQYTDSTAAYTAMAVTGTPSVQAFSPFAPTAAYDATTVGGSGYFDGSLDYLNLATQTAFNCGTGNWTLETWVYITTRTTTYPVMLGNNNGTYSAGALVFGNSNNDAPGNNDKFIITGFDSTLRLVGATTNLKGTWYHVAVVRDSSTSIRMYVNGVQDASNTSLSSGYTFDWGKSGLLIGGGNWDGANSYFNGYLFNMRLIKGTAVYTGAFTPPIAPLSTSGAASASAYPSTTNVNTTFAASECSLLCNFTNAGITDATAKNDLETIGTAQISTAQSKFGGSSIYIPGTATNYVKCATSANLFDIAGADFTIEFWVRFDSVAANRSFVSKYGNSAETAGDLGYNLEWLQSTNQLRLVLGKGTGAGDALYTWSWTPSTGIWYHVAVTRSGTSGRAFVDGAQIGSTLTVITNDVASPNSVIIGKTHTVAQYMNGYMSGIRITKGFARYTGAFTAPTAAFPLQ